MVNSFDKNGHLTWNAILSIKQGTMEEPYLSQALMHICICQECAGALADSFQEDELSEAPSSFKEETICKIRNSDKKHREFIFYSLRVAAAACISLFIVFSSSFSFLSSNIGVLKLKAPDAGIVYSLNTKLNTFSQKIVTMEVFYEKEKR